jgi:hypothetical protein
VTDGSVAGLAPLAIVWALAVILPRPNFFATTHAAAMRGLRAAGAVFVLFGIKLAIER